MSEAARQKRGRTTPAVLVSKQSGVDAAAGLKGRAVLVPTCALAALESVHGPHKYLHGIVKVIQDVGVPSRGEVWFAGGWTDQLAGLHGPGGPWSSGNLHCRLLLNLVQE